MNREDYQKVMRVIDAVIDLTPSRQQAALDEACAGDEALRREASMLLAHHTAAGAFLEESAFDALPSSGADNTFIGRRLGPYRITEEIGRGGMGAVYKAVRDDDQYRAEVAVKLIKRGMDTDFIQRRFRNERQILANLNHPNIARLLDAGTTDDGLPYFVMEYVEGRAIDEYCDARKLSTAERLGLFRKVCGAVQYAHQNLVIHRDLKPSNILITADGTPKLLDFGIAKILRRGREAQTSLTETELRVMTPEYASPEQARGEAITTASDVYSLGVLLYELLTGRRPYRFMSRRPDDVARVICEQEPERPSTAVSRAEEATPEGDTGAKTLTRRHSGEARDDSPDKLRRRLRGDIDNIVLTAMRKEPERRYASVEDFSEDIRRHLEGLPVRARPQTLAYKGATFIKRELARNWRASLTILLAVILLAGSSAVLSAYWIKSRTPNPATQPTIRTIAVLPFNYTGAGSEENPFFGVGLTDTLITKLGKTRRLDVRPMRAVKDYTGGVQNPRLVGQSLSVDAVFNGNVQREGEAVSVFVELIDVRSGAALWAKHFKERLSHVSRLHGALAEEAAQALTLRLTREELRGLGAYHTQSPRAYELYVKGRHFWNKRSPEGYLRAIETFDQAVGEDPNYAEAYAGLADAYALLACVVEQYDRRPERMRVAKEYALRALEIDETIAEAHATLGFIGWHYEWDWAASEKEFKRAIELNPSYATAHQWYAHLLIALGRMDESIAEIKRARALDPLSAIINQDTAEILFYARRFDEAIDAGRKTLELNREMTPNSIDVLSLVALSYYYKGMHEEYILRLQEIVTLSKRDARSLQILAAAYFHLGRKSDGESILAELRRRGESTKVDRYWAFGEKDEVFEKMELEYKNRAAVLTLINVSPQYDALQTDPRFKDYVRKVGLPQ